jgi:hypothetical protein
MQIIARIGRRTAIAAILVAISLVSTACQTTTGREPDPDANNELPIGWIDKPRNGATVGRVVEVAGWALDDSGVRVVRLYVGGRYKASTTIKGRRPDVVAAYPKYGNQNDQAWHATVELGETPGPYHILAQAVDDAGATRDIGSVTVRLISR